MLVFGHFVGSGGRRQGDGRAVASEGKHNGSQEVMTLVVVFVFANDLVEGRWCMWRLCWLW